MFRISGILIWHLIFTFLPFEWTTEKKEVNSELRSTSYPAQFCIHSNNFVFKCKLGKRKAGWGCMQENEYVNIFTPNPVWYSGIPAETTECHMSSTFITLFLQARRSKRHLILPSDSTRSVWLWYVYLSLLRYLHTSLHI